MILGSKSPKIQNKIGVTPKNNLGKSDLLTPFYRADKNNKNIGSCK